MNEVVYNTSISLNRIFVFDFVNRVRFGAPLKILPRKGFVVFWDFRETGQFSSQSRTPGSPVPPEGGEGYTVASGASAARAQPFISASVVSPTLQTGTVLTRGWKGPGQVSIGELRMPLQLFR